MDLKLSEPEKHGGQKKNSPEFLICTDLLFSENVLCTYMYAH